MEAQFLVKSKLKFSFIPNPISFYYDLCLQNAGQEGIQYENEISYPQEKKSSMF